MKPRHDVTCLDCFRKNSDHLTIGSKHHRMKQRSSNRLVLTCTVRVVVTKYLTHQLGGKLGDLRGSVNFCSPPEWHETTNKIYEARENEGIVTAACEEASQRDSRYIIINNKFEPYAHVCHG